MGENAKEDDAVGVSLVFMHFVRCVYHIIKRSLQKCGVLLRLYSGDIHDN